MDAREPTANNADLWARYLSDQWSAWLDPLGVRRIAAADRITQVIAEAAAAGVATWLTTLYAPPIGRLYGVNEPEVTRFVEESAIAREATEIPAQYTVRRAVAPLRPVRRKHAPPVARTAPKTPSKTAASRRPRLRVRAVLATCPRC